MVKKLTKESAQLILGEVPFEKRFFCKDGSVFSTLDQLKKALPQMPKEIFSFHVNKEKNDFYNWIKDVIRDDKLAKAISKEKNKDKVLKSIIDRIKDLEDSIKK